MNQSEVFIDNAINAIYIEDGIVFANYKPDTIVSIEIARQAVRDRLEVTAGKSYPLCGDIRNLVKVEQEASDYLGSDEAFRGISALAIITDTPFQNLFANFYLKFKSSSVPTKLFTNKKKAVFWLKHRALPN